MNSIHFLFNNCHILSLYIIQAIFSSLYDGITRWMGSVMLNVFDNTRMIFTTVYHKLKAKWLHANEEVKLSGSSVLNTKYNSIQDILTVEEDREVEETLSSKHVQFLSSTVCYPYPTNYICVDEWIRRSFTVLCV